jgi:deoxyribodipyrimidine photolyase-related protein
LNRLPYDKNYKEHTIKTYKNKYIDEAQTYVTKHFNDNFGDITDIYYPINHNDALKHLKLFIKNKILDFGPYQDGISKDIIFGSHSVISPFLNNGLLTPDIVINEIMKFYNKLKDKNKHIASIEGLIRQIIGWRSYVRFIYLFHGKDMFEMNQLKHNNKLSSHWFNATTNIEIIDHMINKVSKYAYLHHIERLMVMGNFALLTLLHPKEVYKWFMICFIDSYEWVMIPNVFGMSQYALTNISMMTRPYVSSSKYLLKMSNFKKNEWGDIWDALYWNFINKHKNILRNNYSIALQVTFINKMDKDKLQKYILTATNYIKYIK